MSKYIDAEELKVELDRQKIGYNIDGKHNAEYDTCVKVLRIIDSLQKEQDMGEVSDGYHTFNELYYYRMLYNAAFFNLLPKEWVHKSKRHHTGEECFGGGWFIVMANLPTGQVSNHYELKDWDLFKVPEKEFADEWDGHTPQEAAKRLYEYLQQEQPNNNVKEKAISLQIQAYLTTASDELYAPGKPLYTKEHYEGIHECMLMWQKLHQHYFSTMQDLPLVDLKKEYKEYVEDDPVFSKLTNWHVGFAIAKHFYELGFNSLQQEQPKSQLIQVKCIHPYDESWEKDKVYTCKVWHHSSLDIDFLDVYYDYENNSNYVQFSSIEMLNKEFAIVQQEQPEVDLEKEYKEYVQDDPVFSKLTNRYVGISIAKHFYELGLNAKKEEK